MADLGLLGVFGALGEWFDRLVSSRRERTQASPAAPQCLLRALSQTQSYVHDIQSGAAESRVKEQELSHLWGEAAAAFYGVDKDIAPLLQLKSESWAAPSKWSSADIRQPGITLDAVSEKARRFLAQ